MEGMGPILRQAQNYPKQMCKGAALLIVVTSFCDLKVGAHDSVLALEETMDEFENIEMKELLKDLRQKFDLVTIRAVAKLHDQFGHPSAQALAAALTAMKADPEWIACAKLYVCETCLGRQKKSSVRIVALPRATSFNQVVDIDVFHLLWGENEKKQEKRKVLTIMDEHTRFEVDQPVKKEKAKIITRAIDKYWIAWAGPPEILRADMAGAHMSQEFKDWAENHGIKLQLIAKDAHHQLGMLELKHQVRREQLSI